MTPSGYGAPVWQQTFVFTRGRMAADAAKCSRDVITAFLGAVVGRQMVLWIFLDRNVSEDRRTEIQGEVRNRCGSVNFEFDLRFKFVIPNEIESIVNDMRSEIDSLSARLARYEALAPELKAAATTVADVEKDET